MTTWNYRMVCETVALPGGGTEDVWTVREVFYDDDKSIAGWSADPVSAQGDSKMSLMDDLGKMSAAASFPPFYVVGGCLSPVRDSGHAETPSKSDENGSQREVQ